MLDTMVPCVVGRGTLNCSDISHSAYTFIYWSELDCLLHAGSDILTVLQEQQPNSIPLPAAIHETALQGEFHIDVQ